MMAAVQPDGFRLSLTLEFGMEKHMPTIPPANRSPRGPGDDNKTPKVAKPGKPEGPQHTSEQGDTANIRQNTTKKGGFMGRRMK
jgi:hypothetical protein